MKRVVLACVMAVGLGVSAAPAFAQGDEIQVYDASLASKGTFNLTWHNNFTPKGIKVPSFAGGVTADKSFNGVTEWAYGVSPWFEAGLYLPLYTHDKNLGFGVDGGKLRLLFAALAYTLMERLRALALKGTVLERACTATIRVKLLRNVREITSRFC